MNREQWQLLVAGHMLGHGKTVADVVDRLGVAADSPVAEAAREFVAWRKACGNRVADRAASVEPVAAQAV
jgi:hypothetical protein